ncbi:MAG: DUF368 domain-containing protein [Bacteroidales bacterium]|nr:DUF368 domain-containing protein [Bacteroidales bacterium]
MIKHIFTGLKGFLMGAANVVPGVSGGTIALLTGIYSELIDSINSLMVVDTYKKLFQGKFAEFWKAINGSFLAALFIGVILSIFSLAKVMEYVLAYYPIHTWGFFFGMIAASAVVMLLDIKGWRVSDIIWTVAGIALGVGVCTLSPTTTPDTALFVFICGAIAICTMILPGVSGSFVLLILGKYEYIMTAVSSLNWPVLGAFGLGCVIGILAFSKFLHWTLAHYERQTMLILVGFVIGSLIKVWPWANLEAIAEAGTADMSTLHIPGAIIWMVIGVVSVVLLQILSVKKK